LIGTRRITELARQCANLQVLVHVSSTYVNSYRLEAEEVFLSHFVINKISYLID